jgi:hypothetical protein
MIESENTHEKKVSRKRNKQQLVKLVIFNASLHTVFENYNTVH